MKKKISIFVLIAMVLAMTALPVSATEYADVVIPADVEVDTPEAILDEDPAPTETSESSTFEEPFIPDASANEGNPAEFYDEVGAADNPEPAQTTLPSIGMTAFGMYVDEPPAVVEESPSDVTMISSLSEIDGSGKYALSNNITGEFVTINKGWDVIVDFNGYNLSVNTGRPFDNYGNLTLNAPNGGGVANKEKTGFGAVANNSGAVLTVNGGVYTSNNNGSAVRNFAGGTVTINGGTFNDIRALSNSGNAVINGGTFNQIIKSAYIIYNEGPSLTITNAVVNGDNGGIAHTHGHLIIEGGTFSAKEHYALYMDSESAGKPFSAEVRGGTFRSETREALYINIRVGEEKNNVEIKGGNFTGKTVAANIKTPATTNDSRIITPVISGGTFTSTDINAYVPAPKIQNLADAYPEWTVVTRTYSVDIENGNLTAGKDRFAAGELVSIVADLPVAGKVFDKWMSSGIVVANESSPSTSFEMPENEVTLHATYKDAPQIVIPPKVNFETVYSDFTGPITATIVPPEGSFKYISILVKNTPKTMTTFFSAMADSYIEIFVDPSNYTIGEDGSTITLHEDFIQSLGGGNYIINAVFSGGIATLPLTISTQSAPPAPVIETEENDDESNEGKEDILNQSEEGSGENVNQESDDKNNDAQQANDDENNTSDEKKIIENKETEKYSNVASASKNQVSKAPQTGDQGYVVLNVALVIIALVTIGFLAIQNKINKSKAKPKSK